jgi:hypothetical protein
MKCCFGQLSAKTIATVFKGIVSRDFQIPFMAVKTKSVLLAWVLLL